MRFVAKRRVGLMLYLTAGTTDYMDRFIDEQDPSRDRSSSPGYSSLLYGADGRKSQHGKQSKAVMFTFLLVPIY
jgi:hypothetical protein